MSEFLSVSEMPVPGTVVELLLRDGSVIQTLVGQIDASLVRGWRPVATEEPAVLVKQSEPVIEEPVIEEATEETAVEPESSDE